MNFLSTFSNYTSDDSIILAANYTKFVTINKTFFKYFLIFLGKIIKA
jgi:hypothetical protein